jgi:hypothetical protein
MLNDYVLVCLFVFVSEAAGGGANLVAVMSRVYAHTLFLGGDEANGRLDCLISLDTECLILYPAAAYHVRCRTG